MARGKFRLARVTRLNQQLRREKEREVKATITSLNRVGEQAKAADAEREELRKREQDQPIVDVRDLQLWRQFEAVLATRQLDLKRSAELLGSRLEQERSELIVQRREEKKFVKLQEADARRVEAEAMRQTSFLLDEMALIAHARRKRARDKEHQG